MPGTASTRSAWASQRRRNSSRPIPGARRNARSALITPCPSSEIARTLPTRRVVVDAPARARLVSMPAHGERPSTPDTAQVISDAAVRLFHDRGYHGTSIRDIAGEAKVGIATLFHHHRSKAELLRRIMDAALDDLLAEMEPAVAAAGDDPTARL